MIQIFYKEHDRVAVSTETAFFENIDKTNVLWIDLLDPSGEEKRATEAFLGTEVQSRAKAEEIESSSRFYESEQAVHINTSFLMPSGEEYVREVVSFTLCDNSITTLREVPLRSFTELQRRILSMPNLCPTGYNVFVTILSSRVDLDADMIELLSKDISQYSKRLNQEQDISNDWLIDINNMQENNMLLRENIVDKQRLISNLLKSSHWPVELEPALHVLLKDISSLINHTNFGFERLEYLQDTVVGLINLDQNRIMKIFTLVSLLLMPPTLVASYYGINVPLPFDKVPGAWMIVILFMVLSFLVVFLILKRRKLM